MVSVEVLSFDVWGTLLDTEKMFGLIVVELLKVLDMGFGGGHRGFVERAILKVYDRCKQRRRFEEVDGFDIVVESQNLLAQELGVTRDVVLDAVERAFLAADPRSIAYGDAVATLELLHKLGFRMGIVGNTVFWSSRYTRELLDRLGVARLFEAMLFSDATRINKPDRRIFFLFAKHMNVHPSRVAHVGDSVVEDVGGALSAGMKAIHIDRNRGGKNKIILRELGLAIISELSQVIDALEEL
jgi:putative hydrolase of the HAD superfamily